MRSPILFCVSTALFASLHLQADGPKDNAADQVRPIPPPGVAIPDADRKALEERVTALAAQIAALKNDLAKKPALLGLLPDVEIYHKAVDWALRYNEFFKPQEAITAQALLDEGFARAKGLREGQTPWTTQTGLVVRGYRSRIDGSVQPYGLVVPGGYHSENGVTHRLDVWCHGRGETLSELSFIDQRRKSAGEFTPAGAFVIHPYGRYCNANKFAGEVDLFEALEHAHRNYRIDPARIVMRGFSMGGAAAWQFTVHYPSRWVASNPGAGFSETPEFLHIFQDETLVPTWYEQRLWSWYDCPGWVRNLANCPTVAYSGEDDKQRQAATKMAEAAIEEGFNLTHIIGPKTGHKYHPEAKEEVARRIDQIASRGRDPFPDTIHFSTYTLRYPSSYWVTVQGMRHHWEQARVDAHLDRQNKQCVIGTNNVTALTLQCGPGEYPLDPLSALPLVIDGQSVIAPPPQSDRSWAVHLRLVNGMWYAVDEPIPTGLSKHPGLQGPIDDAFLSKFIVVRPTGSPYHPETAKWVDAELKHFVEHWRRHFRGEIVVRDDRSISDEEIAGANLILWGDPSSNVLIGKIAGQLPLKWSKETLEISGKKVPAASHLPALVYPNPLAQDHYVVLNSGFTYREYDYLNNARQVAKLPDWAVLNISVAPTTKAPAGVADAGFFGESWEVTSPH
jgi:pimeloyl-ACP methyl ester carboxylesterase